VEVLSLDAAGVTGEAVEDGATFAENALKKALYAQQRAGGWCLADDSGLCIDALDGAPGVYSARWAGPGQSLPELALRKLAGIPEAERGASFWSVAALVAPDGSFWGFAGECRGVISKEERGVSEHGLPYDSIFIPAGQSLTFAEMGMEQKNALSHRGQAFAKLREFLSAETLSRAGLAEI
jgi:XTP/dITP diphosphohydrolase